MSASALRTLWAILGLGVLMIGAGLGLKDPWPADEPRFALIARDMVETGQWLIPVRAGEFYSDKPPLFMWAIALFYGLTDSLRLAHLLPNLLAGLGVLALTYDLARRLWDERSARYGTLALLFTVQFTLQARSGQIDGLLCLWTTLGLYGLCRHLLLGPAPHWLYAGCAGMGLGVITKGVGFLPLLLLAPYAYARLRRWPGLPDGVGGARVVLGGTLAFVGAVALWLLPMLLQVAASDDPALIAYRNDILFRQTADRYANPWHHFQPFWYYLVEVLPVLWLPLVALLPWQLPHWRVRLAQRDARTLLLLGYVVLVVLFFSASPAKRGVYLLPALPAFALVCAPALAELWHRPRVQAAGWVLTLLVSVLLGLAAVYLGWLHPEKGLRLVDDLHANPFPLALAWAGLGLVAVLALRGHRGGIALLVFLFGGWQLLGWWGYPLMNEGRSGAGMMRQVEQQLAAGEELAVVDFREQMVLQSRRPITHFGYQREAAAERADAAAWLQAAPGRVLAMRPQDAESCFDPGKAVPIGKWHRSVWLLLRRDALLEPLPDACRATTPVRAFRVEPGQTR